MRGKQVVILGGSVAGLTSALAFARRGAQVRLIERDAISASASRITGDAAPVEAWWRKGVPHARHTHALAALGRYTLQQHAPDVWQALLAAGAIEMPFGAQLHATTVEPRCDDPALAGLAVRRAFVEAVLLPIVRAEPNVTVHEQTAVTGLVLGGSGIATVQGVQTAQGGFAADLTIDASGRGSAVSRWLQAAGADVPIDTVESCGLAYYTRWYRLLRRPSVRLDAGFSAGGYGAASGCIVCPADNGYASITLMVPQADKALHAFDDVASFTAAAQLHPGMAAWLAPGVCAPLSEVLRWPVCENRFRHFVVDQQPVVLGLVPVGDALCITNPTYTRGMSLAMRYAFALADLAQMQGLDDAQRFALDAAVLAQRLVQPWHDDSVLQDRTRSALWAGQPSQSAPGEVTLQRIAAVARHDPVVWQALARRTGMLEAPDTIFANAELVARVRAFHAAARPPPAAQPSREALRQLIAQQRADACAHPLA
ncbi:FAD-dependent oxidoreductase [Xanthomonas campestris]|uniref:FAD-dependent oxidoreductase n=1 Tax=Xanthomonas campestris TaxID=339 RepID=UPI003559305F